MIINTPGHITKMAAMPIYGKTPSKIFFEGTAEPIAMELDMQQLRLKYYNVCINHGPVMTLTDSYGKINICHICRKL